MSLNLPKFISKITIALVNFSFKGTHSSLGVGGRRMCPLKGGLLLGGKPTTQKVFLFLVSYLLDNTGSSLYTGSYQPVRALADVKGTDRPR